MSDPELPVSDSAVNTGPGVSGKWVILGIFAFAICATGGLWVYTWMHHARFFEYRKALVAEFTKKSVPRVDGGREKGHGPEILRVVLNVEFDVLQEFLVRRNVGSC